MLGLLAGSSGLSAGEMEVTEASMGGEGTSAARLPAGEPSFQAHVGAAVFSLGRGVPEGVGGRMSGALLVRVAL